jgi:two-component system, OmpR family, phosphate regulon sensor histidine kinase PhoR
MSKQYIRWIVALMGAGLLGVVGLQVYWLRTAWQLQQEQFSYRVTDALQEVVRTLERQEIWYLARQRGRAQAQQQRLMAITKPGRDNSQTVGQSDSRTIKQSESQIVRQSDSRVTKPNSRSLRPSLPQNFSSQSLSDALQPVVTPLSPEQVQVVETFFRQQEELIAAGDFQAQLEQQQRFEAWADDVFAGQLQAYQTQILAADSAARRRRPNRQPASKLVQKRQKALPTPLSSAQPSARPVSLSLPSSDAQIALVKDVMKEMLLSDRPVEERVDRLTLDTLLFNTLHERGITISYEYGVETATHPASPNLAIRGPKSPFLFASFGVDNQTLRREGYRAALFPNNFFETGNFVYVHFPGQQQYILQRLGLTFAASAVLILVILVCFYIAISTIIRQKKLADIKNDFINNMTHEFKTPISTISLAVEMASEQLGTGHYQTSSPALPYPANDNDNNQRLTRYLGIVRDETRRLGSHVEKVLQMALLDRGEIKLTLAPVNIHDVIETVLNNMSLQLETRQGEVELLFDAENEIVRADPVHLTNILTNLVDNAIKYSPGQPRLSIATQSLPDGVSIRVSDEGLGMTKDQLSRIFEKFYRVPTGNRHDVKGFGLGLSYVKKMIDEHQGRISVESQPDVGSTFEFILPYSVVGD